ncbi:MAG: septum formation initiator family protein [Pseudomonadota bacterium]
MAVRSLPAEAYGLRWLVGILALLLVYLQYQLWMGEGGRMELRDLRRQAADYERENALLRERNAELAEQVMDLKTGNTVLEQRAREELGLTQKDEVYYQFVEPDERPAPVPDDTP